MLDGIQLALYSPSGYLCYPVSPRTRGGTLCPATLQSLEHRTCSPCIHRSLNQPFVDACHQPVSALSGPTSESNATHCLVYALAYDLSQGPPHLVLPDTEVRCSRSWSVLPHEMGDGSVPEGMLQALVPPLHREVDDACRWLCDLFSL
jgi:hypothetical protein